MRNARKLAFVSLVQFLLCCAEPFGGAEESPKTEHRRSATASAVGSRPDLLTLGFVLRRDPDGGVSATYYVHNRGNRPVLICEVMHCSFSVLVGEGRMTFPLDSASRGSSPAMFALIDAPPPARAVSGCTIVSRRVTIPTDLARQLAALRELPAETARNARVAGRVTGSTLRWNTEKREFDAVPLDVSASTEPWERYSRLFGEEIKVPSTKSRARKSGNQ